MTQRSTQRAPVHGRGLPSRRSARLAGLLAVCLGLVCAVGARTVNNCDIRPGTLCDRTDLSGADLAGSDLSLSSFTGSDLSGVDLSRADLHGANRRDATLRRASLRGALMHDIDLERADLRDADLHGVHLRGAGPDARAPTPQRRRTRGEPP